MTNLEEEETIMAEEKILEIKQMCGLCKKNNHKKKKYYWNKDSPKCYACKETVVITTMS